MSGEFESGGGKRRAYRAQLSLLRCGGVRGVGGTGLAVATMGGSERRQGTVAERIASYRLHEGGVGVACCEVVCNTVVTLVRLRPHNDTKRVMREKVLLKGLDVWCVEKLVKLA